MEPLFVLAIQCVFSLAVFAMIGYWFFAPILSKLEQEKALIFLLFIHVFRYLPLALFMPGQISEHFPVHVLPIIAFGDFAAAILAFIALHMLKHQLKGALGMVWFFSIVSVMDIVLALAQAMMAKVYELALGANYFIVSVYVPMIIIAQIMIFSVLLRKKALL